MEEISKILPAAFKKQLHRGEAPLVELLLPLWPRVVGKAIARQCRPVSFALGTLTVATSCPTWAAQLRGLGEEMRAEINRFLGSDLVRKLRIRQDLMVACAAPAISDQIPEPGDPASAEWPDEAGRLEPELARTLRRSYAKYFARGRRKVH